ncbi:hypothetical protein CPC16_007703 [Podila verticillata]|nr:hypothetical protein CPC16_007703 [Podila verticillata]
MAHPHSVSSVDKALAIPELLPKRLLDLFLSRAFREAVLAISAHHLEFDETRIFLKQEQEIFLQVSGGHVHRAKLSADIGMDMDEHNANSLLSKVGQCCPRVKDIVLQVRNASDHTQPDCELATIKTLTSAAKELIYGAKNLETLTLSFEEKAVFFPCQLFLDLAPHAQHVRGLHVMLAEYGGDYFGGDEGMVVNYDSLLPFLEAYPNLSHLAFTGAGFLHGFLYLSDQEATLQPYLHTSQRDCRETVYVLRLMPKLMSVTMRKLHFSDGLYGDTNHQIMLGTFQNMTDNGVRLEHFLHRRSLPWSPQNLKPPRTSGSGRWPNCSTKSRPFFKSPRISFDPAVQVNMTNLGPQVIQRFLFLEELYITSSARSDDLTAFSGRKDLSLTVSTVANQGDFPTWRI